MESHVAPSFSMRHVMMLGKPITCFRVSRQKHMANSSHVWQVSGQNTHQTRHTFAMCNEMTHDT
jgi:hypothetical protein